MASRFNFLLILLLPIFLCIPSLAVPVLNNAIEPVIRGSLDISSRSTDTCADPSLTRTVFESFNGVSIYHTLDFHEHFIDIDSQQASGPVLTAFQGPAFKAWPTQQGATVPLFRLASNTKLDHVYMVGVDAQTPPVLGGFTDAALIAWVYNTAICGSVPLMSANLAAKTDHYYTTDPLEHAGLLALGTGWTDSGVVAFVLPFTTL